MLLRLEQLQCRYDDQPVIRDLSLNVARGELCALLGPSGCGKSTLLHAIGGFIQPSAGRIELDGRTIATAADAVPPEQRGIGMVFQEYALFPHLNVADNVGFGLRHLNRAERARRVADTLALVKLAGFGERFPHELSGGQQQRVALARALAPQPALLLMDEPFSNLDTELRRSLSAEVREILKIAGTTAILVTHDREEAFVMADKLGVLNGGVLQQWDAPDVVYQNPATPAVARFVGDGDFVPGEVVAAGRVRTALGELTTTAGWPVGTELDVYVRPDEVELVDQGGVAARLVSRSFLGTQMRVRLALADGSQVQALLPSRTPMPDDSVQLRFQPAQLVAFERAQAASLA
ncbi:ABC transporter ATP-binding protein [Saccharospirillum mangrovi]|uniref:ABC transporter ATP-binding protein n=1 Tax=Saccharospirillum mangrovi TaxID=2161747 RepID=UPI000D381052|nr:ABC transporter ATP-binding protein [Saccharospirillum mangrovi]